MYLTQTEQYLADYMKKNPNQVAHMSITKLSETTNVSTASIVRTVKKLGYDGFTDYKLSLKEHVSKPVYDNLLIFEKKIRDVIIENEEEVIRTIKNMKSSLIEDALQYIYEAETIYLFAVGLSEQIAYEMELKFHLLNKRCELYTDPLIIESISTRPTKKDVGILISLMGNTDQLIVAAQNMLENDVPIILITANPNGTLTDYSTIQLTGHKSLSSRFPDFEVHSRLPLAVISRVLIDAYVIRFNT